MAAEAYAGLGDAEGAQAHAAAAAEVAGRFESSAWRAMAESSAGNAAVARGAADEALAHFEAAADLFARVGHAYWADRTRAGEHRMMPVFEERSGNACRLASLSPRGDRLRAKRHGSGS
jgi:hypothetical protein